jgi:hypothetical protein
LAWGVYTRRGFQAALMSSVMGLTVRIEALSEVHSARTLRGEGP